LAGVPSGTISYSDFYGKSNIQYWGLDIASSIGVADYYANNDQNLGRVTDGTYVYLFWVSPSTPTYINGIKLDKTATVIWQKRFTFNNIYGPFTNLELDDATIDSSGYIYLLVKDRTTSYDHILKIDSSGNFVTRCSISCSSSLKEKISVDPSGNIVVQVGGYFYSVNNSLTSLRYSLFGGGGGTIYGKPVFTASGATLVAGTQLGNPGYFIFSTLYGTDYGFTAVPDIFPAPYAPTAIPTSVAVDSSGNIYLVGYGNWANSPPYVNHIYIFTVKLTGGASVAWSKVVDFPYVSSQYYYNRPQNWPNNTLDGSTGYGNLNIDVKVSILSNGNILTSCPYFNGVFDSSGNLLFSRNGTFGNTVLSDAVEYSNSLTFFNTWLNGTPGVFKLPLDGSGTGAFAKGSGYVSYGQSLPVVSTYPSTSGTYPSFYSSTITLANYSTATVSTTALTTTKTTITPSTSAGSTSFLWPGTYTWVAPTGVTSVSAVAVGGGGGGGARPVYAGGGGGGALAYKNGYSVTPGASYTVVVGQGGGPYYYSCNPAYVNGGDSAVFGMTAGGGKAYHCSFYPQTGGCGGTYSGACGGGNGGQGGANANCYHGGGGGGAGGYTGNGGAGGLGAGTPASYGYAGYNGSNGSGGGGGGGAGGGLGGCYIGRPGGMGGGVGIFGAGASGTGGAGVCYYTGGSGNPGSYGMATVGQNVGSAVAIARGLAGGGGGGAYECYSGCCRCCLSGFSGQDGAVRIIWGSGRSFPSTNAATP
jgi:hypothetical protein